VSELYEKIQETCMPRGELKHGNWFFADTPIQLSLGNFALFERIYDGEQILTVVSNIGEDVADSQPDTMPILGYNYCLQIIETGFAEQFQSSRSLYGIV
jgi:hypothetical protein